MYNNINSAAKMAVNYSNNLDRTKSALNDYSSAKANGIKNHADFKKTLDFQLSNLNISHKTNFNKQTGTDFAVRSLEKAQSLKSSDNIKVSNSDEIEAARNSLIYDMIIEVLFSDVTNIFEPLKNDEENENVESLAVSYIMKDIVHEQIKRNLLDSKLLARLNNKPAKQSINIDNKI